MKTMVAVFTHKIAVPDTETAESVRESINDGTLMLGDDYTFEVTEAEFDDDYGVNPVIENKIEQERKQQTVVVPPNPEAVKRQERKQHNAEARAEARATLSNPEQFVTLSWEELDEMSKALVVGLWNHSGFPLRVEDRHEDQPSLWCDVIIHHETCLQEDHPLATWDAVAEVDERGFLTLSGYQGPGGHGTFHTNVIPKDVVVSVRASVSH